MSEYKTEGLFLRGTECPIVRVDGFGHSENNWWIIAWIQFEDGISKTAQHPATVVHEDTEEARANMDAIDKGMMDHLLEHGEFDRKTGNWKATSK